MVRTIVRVLALSIRIVANRSGATMIQLTLHNIERHNHRFGEAVSGVRTFVRSQQFQINADGSTGVRTPVIKSVQNNGNQ
jgi:hypothetical protein